jgi:hypothetical protein
VIRLQGLTTLIGQLMAQLEAFVVTLSGLCTVTGPHDEASVAAIDDMKTISRGSYSTSVSDVRDFMQGLGLFVMQSLDELDMMEVVAVERSIAGVFSGLVDGIAGVGAQRKDSNDAE